MKRWSRDRPATFDVIWRNMIWHDVTWRGKMWHDGTWRDVTWRDITWYDMTWHDVPWRDMRYITWHDVAWRDMTWHDVTWRDMTWHDETWRDMTWHDVKWRDIMRHNATWRDMTRRYATWRDMTCDPYLNATRMNSTACEMAEILSKNYQNLFRSEAFYRRFIKSAPASIKPKSAQNTDFVTQLGKWISAVPEPFRMKFSTNVEKLFP